MEVAHDVTHWTLLALWIVASGCGARTDLDAPDEVGADAEPPSDGGTAPAAPHETSATARLRVELFWNPPDRSCDSYRGADCDATDLDLHLLRPGAEPWFDAQGDCHWANCLPDDAALDWSPAGSAGDPRLSLDDRLGHGPEAIDVPRASSGTYRVGVHYFGRWRGEARATVSVACDGRPAGSLEDVPIPPFTDGRPTFWRVADVEVGGEARCRLRPVGDGEPMVGLDDARRRR